MLFSCSEPSHDYGTGIGKRINGCDIHDVAGVNSGRFHGDGSLGMFTSWAWDNGKPSNTFIYDNKFTYTSGGENTLKDTINFVCRDNIWSGDKSVVIE